MLNIDIILHKYINKRIVYTIKIMPTNKTIPLTENTKKRLISAKIYPRETFDDIIRRLLDGYKKK